MIRNRRVKIVATLGPASNDYDTIRKLQRQYRIPVSRVYTHQELSPTRCPGKTLQPRMVRFRRDGTLV